MALPPRPATGTTSPIVVMMPTTSVSRSAGPGRPICTDVVDFAKEDARLTDRTTGLEVIGSSTAAGADPASEGSGNPETTEPESPYGPIAEAVGERRDDLFSDLEAREP